MTSADFKFFGIVALFSIGFLKSDLLKADLWTQLLRVTSDSRGGVTDIRLELNDQLQIISLRHFSNDVEQRIISLDEFAKGAILLKSGDYEVIKLVCKNCSPISGGIVEMVYLNNGIFNSYGTFPMDLHRVGDHWRTKTVGGGDSRDFSSMFLEGRFLFGSLIGIKNVIVR